MTTTPIIIKITPINAILLIDCFNIKKHKIAAIAPEVFSIGSEIDSSKKIKKKNENAIAKIYKNDTGINSNPDLGTSVSPNSYYHVDNHKAKAFFAGTSSNHAFYVTHDGYLYASDVDIKGNITADTLTANSSGTIGGWNISNDKLWASSTVDG